MLVVVGVVVYFLCEGEVYIGEVIVFLFVLFILRTYFRERSLRRMSYTFPKPLSSDNP